MILEYRTATWWYWLATLVLLAATLAGWTAGLLLTMFVTTLHAAHFIGRGHALTSFPLQVRLTYLALLAIGAWPPMAWLHGAMLVGTLARVMFAYCFLARTLSLFPWNLAGSLDWARVRRTYLTRPSRSSILVALVNKQTA